MSDAKANTPSPADPFAAQKATIRDTVKWMVAAYSGLAAVLIAGVSLSGLGAVPPDRLAIAAVAGAFVLGFVLAALNATLSVLIGDNCFAGDLDTATRALIDKHAEDILPARFSTWDALIAGRRQARADLQAALAARFPAREPDPPLSAQQISSLDDAIERADGQSKMFEAAVGAIIGQAHLFVLQEKLRDLRGRLATLTVLGTIALVICIWALTPPKPSAPTPVTKASSSALVSRHVG